MWSDLLTWGPDVPMVKPEGPPFPLALQSGGWQPPSRPPVKVPAGDSLPQQAASLPPLSQISWASQTNQLHSGCLNKQQHNSLAQSPSWGILSGPLSPPLPPRPKPLSGKSSPSRDNDSALTVGTFARLNVYRHLVKCPRPSFQRTIPPHRVCLSRQSQIRGGLSPLFKS